ncbi:2OG-Fe(II) oxygenase [Roseateles chitosanitabidus]|jgi:prolyl 4-hydroxylase|uniref:2OG-Fe(II) oxygenase n=1 Tax=Roseateles chitosanitabidus TaxID=65048 RepID=UPI0008338996|nr:2OG-Fe(II) oxygenase [Roseateles chitosanitabidus]
MSTIVRFPPALGDWVRGHLDEGVAPAELRQALRERAIAAEAAQAIVDAFVRARLGQAPMPVDHVALPDPIAPAASADPIGAPPYRHETPRLRPGTSIATNDRVVGVAARAARPMLAVLNGVFSADECEALIALARGRLRPSTLVDPTTGLDVVSGLRASHGMFFRPAETPLIARLDRRIAEIMNLPVSHGEGLQILHYPEGAGSAPHYDFLVPSNPANQASIARSGQRVSTLVTYLNDVPAGGETVFPAAGWAVSPQRGHAVYFEYANGQGELDHASLHASGAVTQGEKWVATKWMRERPFVSA